MAQTKEDIQILDVIHHYNQHSKAPQVFVVISRNPEYVYAKEGNRLSAHDSGFYNFMYIDHNGFGKAFAGREFDINLSDGATLHCSGQVWSGGGKAEDETIHVGCATEADLYKCNVFCGAEISKQKYDAWMAINKPSHNYEKYSKSERVEYWSDLYQKYPDWDKVVCAKRARKLRRRGVTIRRNPVTGTHGWSKSFESHVQEIARRASPDYLGRFHPNYVVKP